MESLRRAPDAFACESLGWLVMGGRGGKNQGGSGHVGGTRQKGGEGAEGQSGAKSEGRGETNKGAGSGHKSGQPGGERRNDK